MLTLRYPFCVPETVEFYRRYCGPTQRAFEALSADQPPALRRDLADVWTKHQRATDGTLMVEASLRLEPHETTHYQNRAALFTLLREPDAYHTAWFELNRHQYRLVTVRLIKPERPVGGQVGRRQNRPHAGHRQRP